MNYEQARRAIEAHVAQNWTTPIAYDNVAFPDGSNKPPATEWARLAIRYNDGFAASLGNSHWRRTGIIGFQIFIPQGDSRGTALLGQLKDQAAALFEGVRLQNDLFIERAIMLDLGNTEDSWYQTNCNAPFRFDEFK